MTRSAVSVTSAALVASCPAMSPVSETSRTSRIVTGCERTTTRDVRTRWNGTRSEPANLTKPSRAAFPSGVSTAGVGGGGRAGGRGRWRREHGTWRRPRRRDRRDPGGGCRRRLDRCDGRGAAAGDGQQGDDREGGQRTSANHGPSLAVTSARATWRRGCIVAGRTSRCCSVLPAVRRLRLDVADELGKARVPEQSAAPPTPRRCATSSGT